MSGGHSGIDIHRGKANAIKILVQVIEELQQSVEGIRIVDFKGGSTHNAIPREASAKVLLPTDAISTAKDALLAVEKRLTAEYQNTEPHLFIHTDISSHQIVEGLTSFSSHQLIDLIKQLPHGIASMSTDIVDAVETSNNLATIKIEAGQLMILTSQRSSVKAKLDTLTQKIENKGGDPLLLGASTEQNYETGDEIPPSDITEDDQKQIEKFKNMPPFK